MMGADLVVGRMMVGWATGGEWVGVGLVCSVVSCHFMFIVWVFWTRHVFGLG